jgi:hypothetical protein
VGDFASFVSAGKKPVSGNGNRDGRRLSLNVGLVDSKGEAFEAVHAVETIPAGKSMGWVTPHAVREATSYRRNFPQTMPRT